MWDPTPEELTALRERYASEASDAEFTLWVTECKERNLRPVTDLILMPRRTKKYSKELHAYEWLKQFAPMTSINALRRLAERTGKYAGPLPSEFIYLENGKPTLVSDLPLPDPKDISKWLQPWLVRAYVKRSDFDKPVVGLARWGAYAQFVKDGNKYVLNSVWTNRGPEQLEKCAKAQALREAFPEELGGLYTQEELHDDLPDEVGAPQEEATLVEPPAPVPETPEVNQAPAEPEVRERPGKAADSTETPEPAKKTKKNKPKKQDKKTDKNKKKEPTISEPSDPMEAPIEEAGEPEPEPPGKGPSEQVDEKLNELPDADEFVKIRKKLGSYNVEVVRIGRFINAETGKTRADQLTRAEWTAAFAKLDGAKKLTAAAFESLLNEAEKKLEEK